MLLVVTIHRPEATWNMRQRRKEICKYVGREGADVHKGGKCSRWKEQRGERRGKREAAYAYMGEVSCAAGALPRRRRVERLVCYIPVSR
jgi:hypothetical protein